MVINYRSLLNFDQLVHFEKIVEKCIYNNLINKVVDCIAVERRICIVRKLLVKAGRLLCACSVVISPLVVEGCKTRYYQPKEPDGLEEFAKKSRQ